MMLSWKTLMMDSKGLPNALTARADKPYLLFINRPKLTGRAFLNLPEIVEHVRVCCVCDIAAMAAVLFKMMLIRLCGGCDVFGFNVNCSHNSQIRVCDAACVVC
mgnify:CR=1 FL=1